MKKALTFAFLLVLGISLVSSASVDSEIQKLTKYAEDFETGNINYVQLLVYSSAVREQINEKLGVTNKEMGGVLKEEQLKSALGEATERTKWAWSEESQRETKLDQEVSAWRKIIFDGKKIQIWINSWPTLIKTSQTSGLVYRLNFDINFKEPSEELNINERILEIKGLAEVFNKEPSKANAEALAKESVNAERIFEMFMRQSSDKCEEVMKGIFGAENKKQNQKMFVQEISLYEGEDFELTARLEMCEECEWKWINLDVWFNGRGPGFKMPDEQGGEYSAEQFKDLSSEAYKQEITNILAEIKSNLEQKNYGKISSLKNKLRAVNEAWNQKSNDVWQEVDKMFKQSETMTPEEQSKLGDYWWIKQEQQKRDKVNEIVTKNYQERKEVYLTLFSGYDKKESYFEQVEYEKRLVEEFREFGKEMCSNNQDDNKNKKIDCADDQCLGQKCGVQKVSVMRGNETIEEERELFCIAGSCQLKEESVVENETICGNHMCEIGEEVSCAMDCAQCSVHEAVNCTGRVIFKGKDASGCPLEPICLNETNTCQKNEDCLQPLCGKAECVESKCVVKELAECREAECVDREENIQSCSNGEKVVKSVCEDGSWRETGTSCSYVSEGNDSVQLLDDENEEAETKLECSVKEDCGNQDDVCSNGRCVTLPKVVEDKKEDSSGQGEIKKGKSEQGSSGSSGDNDDSEEQKEESSTNNENGENTNQETEGDNDDSSEGDSENSGGDESEPASVTGEVISLVKTISGKVTGFVVGLTGFDVEENSGQEEGTEQTEEQEEQTSNEQENNPEQESENDREEGEESESNKGRQEGPTPQQSPGQEDNDDRREVRRGNDDMQRDTRGDDDRERREKEDSKRREVECKDNCNRECKNNLVAPCVGECVRKSECKEASCLDAEIVKCETSCKEEKGFDKCAESCQNKCQTGEKMEIERQEEEHKEEKGVFKAGGTCRATEGSQKTEAYIYFDGWGEPFKQIQPLKQKYYSGGNADWCKKEFENLLKQRKEIEKGLNQEFVTWFFEKYLANSADEWEQHVSGIFELYWKDVDTSRQLAERMNCLDMKELPSYSLINVKYETDYGKVELWEEVKNVKLPGLDEERQVISPYMKVWVFPSKEFIISEMKKAMRVGQVQKKES